MMQRFFCSFDAFTVIKRLWLLPWLLGGILSATGQGLESTLAGDGKTNDAPAIQRALDHAMASGQSRVVLPAGTFLITEPLRIPSNVALEGAGKRLTQLQVPADAGLDAVVFKDVKKSGLGNLSLIGTSAETDDLSAGIRLQGQTARITINSVHVDGFGVGLSSGSAAGDAIFQLVVRHSHLEEAGQQGVVLNRTDGALIEHCYLLHNGSDGLRLAETSRNVVVRGGEASFNGLGGAVSGHGVDVAGGRLLIEDLLTEGNSGSGIHVGLSDCDWIESSQEPLVLLSGIRTYRNAYGIEIKCGGLGVNSVDESTGWAGPATIRVQGGVIADNHNSGIYVQGRKISLLAPIIRDNGTAGIELLGAAQVRLVGALISGNGTNAPGVYPGVQVGGKDLEREAAVAISIDGSIINGIGSDEVEDAFLIGDVPVVHAAAIAIGAAASNVVIDSTIMVHYTGERSITSDQPAAASLLVHYGSYGGDDPVGGKGSTRVRAGQPQVKVTDVTDAGGWQNLQTVR